MVLAGDFFNDYIMGKKVNEPIALGSLNTIATIQHPLSHHAFDFEVQDFVTAI